MVPLCAKLLQNPTTATTIPVHGSGTTCQTTTITATFAQCYRYITAPDYSHYNSTPTNSQAPVLKRDNTPSDNATSLDDVFMPKDDAINSSDGEIEEIYRELEEFKRFCLLTKPLENRPKITLPFVHKLTSLILTPTSQGKSHN